MRIILVKNPITINATRRCLNCGTDISHKRKDARFCCPACYEGYYGLDHVRAKQDVYLFNAI